MRFIDFFWWFLGGDKSSKELIDSTLRSSCKEQKHPELQENTDFSADDEFDFQEQEDFFE